MTVAPIYLVTTSCALVAVVVIAIFFTNPYLLGLSSNTQTVESFQVIATNVDLYGHTASIPSCAMRVPCVTYTNIPTVAELLRYNGTYYYESKYNLSTQGSTATYTIWYNNSTYFCISPKVSWAMTCP